MPDGSKVLTSLPARTAADRLAGERPSRTKALLTASVAAVAAGVIVYKLLRNGGDGGGDEGE